MCFFAMWKAEKYYSRWNQMDMIKFLPLDKLEHCELRELKKSLQDCLGSWTGLEKWGMIGKEGRRDFGNGMSKVPSTSMDDAVSRLSSYKRRYSGSERQRWLAEVTHTTKVGPEWRLGPFPSSMFSHSTYSPKWLILRRFHPSGRICIDKTLDKKITPKRVRQSQLSCLALANIWRDLM